MEADIYTARASLLPFNYGFTTVRLIYQFSEHSNIAVHKTEPVISVHQNRARAPLHQIVTSIKAHESSASFADTGGKIV